MLVVTIDIWPKGHRPGSAAADAYCPDGCRLDRLIIVNDTTGNGEVGNYDIWRGDPERRGEWEHLGRIEGQERNETHRAELVARALALAFADAKAAS